MNSIRNIKFFAAWCFLVTIISVFFFVKYNIRNKNYQFSGIVQSVTYNDKGSPDVVINGKKYSLISNDWVFDNRIQAGDSLVKRKDSFIIKLVKQKTGEVTFFK